MNHDDPSASCPGVDLKVPYKHNPSFTVEDYIVKHLPKTFEIIKSTPSIENEVIVDFFRAGIKDHHLPFSKALLLENLGCSSFEAEDFIVAQSPFFAVSFAPKEYRDLGPLDSVPFVLDARNKSRRGGYGTVEKVFEGNKAYARKIIRDQSDLETIMMEIRMLRLATDSENQHLLRIRCAYQQEDQICILTYPWCDLDLDIFIKSSRKFDFWNQRTPKEKLILITNWMVCMASGVSELHKKKIKHLDLKPESVLLDSDLQPVICDFGLSKVYGNNSKSVRFHRTPNYMPPEHLQGKVGRKSDIFSLGLVFVELALHYFGQRSLKKRFTDGCYSDIIKSYDDFLAKKLPLRNKPVLDDWNRHFQSLIRSMLDVTPENRPKASEVWEKARELVEILGANPHCEKFSPLGLIPSEDDEMDDDMELTLAEDLSLLY